MSLIIKSSEFEEKVLKSNLPVIVDFFADWCGPCKMMAPVLDSLNEQAAGKIAVYKINVDNEPLLTAKYDIVSVPTFIFFKDGEEKDRKVGIQTMESLLERAETL